MGESLLTDVEIDNILAGSAGPKAPSPTTPGLLTDEKIEAILASAGVPPEPGLAARAAGAGLGAIGTLASVLDYPRRALWTLGYMATGSPLSDAWEEASTATNLVTDLFPDLEDSPIVANAIGIGLEILTDPLTYIGVGLLSKGGKAAQIKGKLAATWAHQARAGHRSLLQLMYPIIEDGSLKIARKQILKAPRMVEGIGYVGRLIRYPRSVLRNRAWTAAGMEAWTTTLEGMEKVARPVMEAGADTGMQLLRLKEEKLAMMSEWGPDVMEQTRRLMEHVDLPSRYHREIVEAASPELLERAKLLKTVSDTIGDIRVASGLPTGQLGGGIRRALKEVDWLATDELGELRKIVKSPLMNDLAQDEAQVLRKYVATRHEQLMATEQVLSLDQMLAETKATRERATAFQVVPDPGATAVRTIEKRLFKRRQEVQALDVLAGEMLNEAYSVAGKAGLDSRTKKLLAQQDMLPNHFFRVMDPKAKARFAELSATEPATAARLFDMDTNGMMHRHFTERLDNATGDILEHGVKADADTIYREMSESEILELAKKPPVGQRLEKTADLFQDEGMVNRLLRISDKKAPFASKRFYQSDPNKWFDEVSHKVVSEVRKKEFVQSLRQVPGIVSDTPISGWHHIRELDSTVLAKELGEDVYIHPEMFHEIAKVMTRTLLPSQQGRNAALALYDKLTRVFKTAVTTPESFLGKYGKLPIFPAYHFRNSYSDHILMLYNGPYSLKTVLGDGWKVARGSSDDVIDIGGKLGKQSADELKRMGIAYGVTFGEDTTKITSAIGQRLENQRRLGYFVDRLKHGFSPYHAAKETKRVLFDYTDLTNVEKVLFRRVVPFWSWIRNNVRLQVGTMLSRPGLTMAQLRIGGSVKKMPDAPPWIRGRMMIALDPDKQTGEERMLTGIGLPVEDIAELLDFHGGYKEWVRQMAFRANPYLKLGLSRAIDFDVERMRPFDRPTSAPYLKWADDKAPGIWKWLKDSKWVAARKHRGRDGKPYYTVNPHFDHFMRSLPSARAHSQLKSFAHPGSKTKKALGWLTGFREIRYHPDRVRRAEDQSEARKVLEGMRRVGDISIYEIPYARGGSSLSRSDVRRLRRQVYGR